MRSSSLNISPPPPFFKSTFVNLCITDNIMLCLPIISEQSLFWPRFEPGTCRTQVSSVTTWANLCTVYFTGFFFFFTLVTCNTFQCTSKFTSNVYNISVTGKLEIFFIRVCKSYTLFLMDHLIVKAGRFLVCRLGIVNLPSSSFFHKEYSWVQSCLLMVPLEKVHSCNKYLQWPNQPTMTILLWEKVYPYTYVCYVCCCMLGLIHWNILYFFFFNVLLTVHLSIFLNVNQLDALNFIISLFQASTCFEHMCSSSGGQNCIIQSLVSSHWNKWELYFNDFNYFSNFRPLTCFSVMIPETV